jgi:hypothetical protein
MARSGKTGRNDPCPCGSGKKYKRCCIGRETEPSTASEVTLFVDTKAGVMVRRVPAASRLRSDRARGYAAEDATREAASIWGLPDFVYYPEVSKVGSGSREIGDCLLIVGDLAASVQVKSREVVTADRDRERSWVEKKVREALNQANGTIRRLQREPVRLTNGRGRTIEVDGNQMRWVSVAVIDHPDPPEPSGESKESRESRSPTVVLDRRDWEFLFDQLKSVHAVVGYLHRVADDPGELGSESVRYYQLAQADEDATPREVDPALLAAGGYRVSAPLLPLAPAGTDDEAALVLVRSVYEDLATSPTTGGRDEKDRLKALAALDSLPVALRANIGRFLIDGLEEAARVPDEDGVQWRFRRPVGRRGEAHLGFGVCSQQFKAYSEDPMHHDVFGWWVQLRHHELQQITGDPDLTTVGVVLSPRHDGQRLFDTTMAVVSGDLSLTDEELAAFGEFWSHAVEPQDDIEHARSPA